MTDVTHFDSPVSARFEVDEGKRTITGLAVPYGVSAMSNGQRFQFSKATIGYGDVSRVKVLLGHDFAKAVGVVTNLDDTDEGLMMTARIAKGAAGDEALSMAAEGVWDGLSVGLGTGGKYQARQGVQHAVSVPLREISLTPIPSFDDARVRAVAASQEVNQMDPENEIPTPTGPDFAGLTEALTAGIAAGFADLRNPQGEGREVVPAGRPLQVSEPSPYRFDGHQGAQSFSEDLRGYASDPEARKRLDQFMEESFAVTTANVSSLNVPVNRPDLYVPNLQFTRPLWDLVTTGSVDNQTPFTLPKFASATGLVGPHTQGVEPTPGAFTATSQTISPAPVSGKVEIVREVWDQGGSPQADMIIWGEIQNAYFEAIEAKIATMLNGLTLTEINFAGATGAALITAMENVFIDLQFVRGGNRYSALALDGMLFKALIGGNDANGRPLLPVVNPTNADGGTEGNFSAVRIGAQTGVAAWALGASNASNSYLFVPSSVYCWASAPKKFVFEYRVSAIDLAVWGYTASAVLRDTDVKRLDYTTADV